MTREFTNEDCMELMARYPDKHFDLAIVDPPYGIGDKLLIGGKGPKSTVGFSSRYKKGGWVDEAPESKYFDELFRVSKNQIIWGGNYFHLPPTRGFIFWDKLQPIDNYSSGEFAWTSFDRPAKAFRYMFTNVAGRDTDCIIHPTQKPVALYKWLLTNYAKPGDLILDTHVGSASSLIACEEKGFEYVACELDSDYFAAATERIRKYRQQLRIDFDSHETTVPGTQLRIT